MRSPTRCLAEISCCALTKARLFAARGRVSDAARVLDDAPWGGVLSPYGVLLELERARVVERRRDRARAIEGYHYVAGMWRHADRELQPLVT